MPLAESPGHRSGAARMLLGRRSSASWASLGRRSSVARTSPRTGSTRTTSGQHRRTLLNLDQMPEVARQVIHCTGRRRANFGRSPQILSSSLRMRLSSPLIWPNSSQTWPTPICVASISVELVQHHAKRSWPMLGQSWSDSNKLWPEIRRTWLGGRASLERFRPEVTSARKETH